VTGGGGRLEPGRAAFNRGEYWAAHELWEEVWRTLDGAERTSVQGLIQIAAGLHHLQGGRLRPGTSLLRKGLEKLVGGTSAPLERLPLDALARQVTRLVAALAAPGATVPAVIAITL
jgi:predicted metal-dependent hydrolase